MFKYLLIILFYFISILFCSWNNLSLPSSITSSDMVPASSETTSSISSPSSMSLAPLQTFLSMSSSSLKTFSDMSSLALLAPSLPQPLPWGYSCLTFFLFFILSFPVHSVLHFPAYFPSSLDIQ